MATPKHHRTASLGLTFFWGIAVFCGFAFLAWVLFHFAVKPETYEDKRAAARVEKRGALEKENEQKLTTYAWVDKAKGTVQLPIERAIELAVADLASEKRPVHPSSVKVENPYPAGLLPPPGADPAVAPTKNIGLNPSASPAPVAPNVNLPDVQKQPVPGAPAASAAPVPNTGAQPAVNSNAPNTTP